MDGTLKKKTIIVKWDNGVERISLVTGKGNMNSEETYSAGDLPEGVLQTYTRSNTSVIVALPSNRIFIDEIFLPFNDNSRIARVIESEFADKIPADEKMRHLWYKAGETKDKNRYLVAAVPEKVYKEAISAGSKYGKVQYVLPYAACILESWIKKEEYASGYGALLVNYKNGVLLLIKKDTEFFDLRWISGKKENITKSVVRIMEELKDPNGLYPVMNIRNEIESDDLTVLKDQLNRIGIKIKDESAVNLIPGMISIVQKRTRKGYRSCFTVDSNNVANTVKSLKPAIMVCFIALLFLCIQQTFKLKNQLVARNVVQKNLKLESDKRLDRFRGNEDYKALHAAALTKIRKYGDGFERNTSLVELLSIIGLSMQNKKITIESIRLNGRKTDLIGYSRDLKEVRDFEKKLLLQERIKEVQIRNVLQQPGKDIMRFELEIRID